MLRQHSKRKKNCCIATTAGVLSVLGAAGTAFWATSSKVSSQVGSLLQSDIIARNIPTEVQLGDSLPLDAKLLRAEVHLPDQIGEQAREAIVQKSASFSGGASAWAVGMTVWLAALTTKIIWDSCKDEPRNIRNPRNESSGGLVELVVETPSSPQTSSVVQRGSRTGSGRDRLSFSQTFGQSQQYQSLGQRDEVDQASAAVIHTRTDESEVADEQRKGERRGFSKSPSYIT